MVAVWLWWWFGYGGGLAMVVVWLWWWFGYGGGLAMVVVWLWWWFGYGGGLACVFFLWFRQTGVRLLDRQEDGRVGRVVRGGVLGVERAGMLGWWVRQGEESQCGSSPGGGVASGWLSIGSELAVEFMTSSMLPGDGVGVILVWVKTRWPTES